MPISLGSSWEFPARGISKRWQFLSAGLGQQPHTQSLFYVLWALEDTLCAPPPVHTPFRQTAFTSERWSFEQFPSVAVPSPPLKLKVWSTDWWRGRIIWELVRNEELGPSPRPTETKSAF